MILYEDFKGNVIHFIIPIISLYPVTLLRGLSVYGPNRWFMDVNSCSDKYIVYAATVKMATNISKNPLGGLMHKDFGIHIISIPICVTSAFCCILFSNFSS